MKTKRKNAHPNNGYIPVPHRKATRGALEARLLFYRAAVGKVLTPLKVYSARLPSAFGLFYGKVSKLDKKLTLPRELVFLTREQVARINICRFCTDIGRWFSIQESMNQAKFEALEEYSTSALFTDAERAALDYARKLTKNKTVHPNTFAALARYIPSAKSARSSGWWRASTSTT